MIVCWVGGRVVADEQGNAGLGLVVEGEVDGVKARLIKLQLLDVDDEVAGAEVHVFGQGDFDWGRREVGDGMAVGIDEVEFELVLAFVAAEEGEAQGDGALGMNGGELLGVNGVEGAQQVQFPVVVGCRVAENGHLNIHPHL